MISRRNIRVKVMQTLYSLSSYEKSELGDRTRILKMLDERLEHVLDVFTVCVLYPIRVAQYAELDANQRSSKYLKSSVDINVDTRIANNTYVANILSKASFNEKVRNSKLDRFVDEEWVKKLFGALQKSEEYQNYLSAIQHTSVQDKEIIQHIWEKLILENEEFLNTFNDEMPGWEDNYELITILMENFFRNSSKVDFVKLLTQEKKEYAHDLLETVLDKEELCMSLIEPKLKNWDKERVALIDLLLLRMGICEFIFFPTIPTKVTINEYIDIAKMYSLPQSGQFINGVLDNILKDLEKENKVQKNDHK